MRKRYQHGKIKRVTYLQFERDLTRTPTDTPRPHPAPSPSTPALALIIAT